jgi:hypothetical protein
MPRPLNKMIRNAVDSSVGKRQNPFALKNWLTVVDKNRLRRPIAAFFSFIYGQNEIIQG